MAKIPSVADVYMYGAGRNATLKDPDADARSSANDAMQSPEDILDYLKRKRGLVPVTAAPAPAPASAAPDPTQLDPGEAKKAHAIVSDVQKKVADVPESQKPEALQAQLDGLKDQVSKTGVKEYSKGEKMAVGLLAVLPTLIGGAFGGAKGASAGADISGKSIGDLASGEQDVVDKTKAGLNDKIAQLNARVEKREERQSTAANDALKNETEIKTTGMKNASAANVANIEGQTKRDVAEIVGGSKKDKRTDDQFFKLNDALDPNKARAGNMGTVQANINKAERLEALLSSTASGNLPSAQVAELAQGLAGLINGGNGPASDHQIQALVPRSRQGDTAKIVEWLKGEPTGADQQKFIALMAHTIQREKGVLTGQLNKAQKARLAAFEHLKDVDPDRYKQQLAGFGLDENGDPIGASPAPASAAPEMRDVGGIKYIKVDGGWKKAE